MSEKKRSLIAELISDLKRQRDELRLQIHLGGEELKDEWDNLEAKLSQLNDRFEPVKDAVEDTAGDVWESLKLVGGEIREGYSRIRKSL